MHDQVVQSTSTPPATRRAVIGQFVRHAIADIPLADRELLFDRLYAIFCENYTGLDRSTFEAHYLRPNNEIGLCHAGDGTLAGFISVSVEEFRVAGRTYTVFGSLVFILLNHRGGTDSIRFGLRTALRHKLRHPFSRMVHVTVAATPAAYELNAKFMPRVYPSRHAETPTHFRSLIDAVIERRGLVPLATSPRLVARDMIPRQPGRVSSSTVLRRSADVEYFNRIAPDWSIGVSPMMCIPVQLRDMIGAAWGVVRRALCRRFRA